LTLEEPLLNEANEARWYYKSNEDPWNKSEEEEWTEFAEEETRMIEEALSLSKETVEVGDYIVYLKEKIQVHKQDNSRQRPLKRVFQSPEPSLREVRFSFPPSRPIAVNQLTSVYPLLILLYNKNTRILKYHGYDLLFGKLPDIMLEGLMEACIAGTIEEGFLFGQEDEALRLASVLENYQGSKQDIIGEVCVQIYTAETFLYKVLNKALREENVSKANTLAPFCILLFFFLYRAWHGYVEFPGYKMQVYRGCQLSPELIEVYKEIAKKEKSYFAWDSFTSTSKNRRKAERYGNTLFIIC